MKIVFALKDHHGEVTLFEKKEGLLYITENLLEQLKHMADHTGVCKEITISIQEHHG